MNVLELGENQVVHCSTKEQALEILKILHNAGRKWCNGASYMEDDWEEYGIETCYYPHEASLGSLEYFKEGEYEIFDASLFLNQIGSLIIF